MGWPNGGSYRGHTEVLEGFFPKASKAWDHIKPYVDYVLQQGERFVVRGKYVGVASGTHRPFSVDYVHIWRVQDGKLIELEQIADTAVLAEAGGRITPA